MIYFILGIIAGVLLLGFSILCMLAFRTPIQRTVSQLQSKFAPKGSIIEPESEELSSWLEKLPTE